MILVSFCATAQDSYEIEARLHKIYVEHYSNPVLDSDWFKIVDAIEEQSYSVKKGDTLWGISKIYFGDGFYWSKLWSVNQNITNPHMISVNDTLNFRSGSFSSAPSLSVVPADSEVADGTAVTSASSSEENFTTAEPEITVSAAGGGPQVNDIPTFFKNSARLKAPNLGQVSVEKRPPIHFDGRIRLDREVLATDPVLVGKVIAVGTDRINTGETNKIVLSSVGKEGITSGAVLSVLDNNIRDNLSSGSWVKTLAVVRVRQLVRGTTDQYEADVIEQFDGILVGSPVSTYQVKTVDLNISSGAQELDLQVLRDKTKSVWSVGDIILLQSSTSQPRVGEMAILRKKFAPETDFLTPNSIIKVVAVSPPFVTGIVMDSRTPITNTADH